MLDEALGDLADRVEIESNDDPSTESPIDTPLWDSLARVSGRLVEGSALVPFLMVGGTDNRFFRRAGSVGYGFGLFSRRLTFEDYATMFHGNDERVDVESLGLSEAALGSRRPRPPRLGAALDAGPQSSIAAFADASDARSDRRNGPRSGAPTMPDDELHRRRPLDRRDDPRRRASPSRRTHASTSSRHRTARCG